MQRRLVLCLPALLAATGARAEAVLIEALRGGRAALLLRHARTEPGVGDPPGYRLGDCASQRQLSADGRQQAQRIGEWFAARDLRPAQVRSSAWCRCLDTATLAFGRAEAWPALNSFFDDRRTEAAQSEAMRRALAKIPAGRFEAWVTHQVNISAFAGEGPAMGEAIVVRHAGGRVHNLGRLRFDP